MPWLFPSSPTLNISRPIWLLFSRWFAHLCFGLGRGPMTPPDPATVLMDRKDLNSNKTKLWIDPGSLNMCFRWLNPTRLCFVLPVLLCIYSVALPSTYRSPVLFDKLYTYRNRNYCPAQSSQIQTYPCPTLWCPSWMSCLLSHVLNRTWVQFNFVWMGSTQSLQSLSSIQLMTLRLSKTGSVQLMIQNIGTLGNHFDLFDESARKTYNSDSSRFTSELLPICSFEIRRLNLLLLTFRLISSFHSGWNCTIVLWIPVWTSKFNHDSRPGYDLRVKRVSRESIRFNSWL